VSTAGGFRAAHRRLAGAPKDALDYACDPYLDL
jgi:hypothetical protein